MSDKAEKCTDYRDRLVAHRGYQKLYPENTLLAYQQAIAAGALAVETDVLLSADKQAVLYHDPTLQRVSGRKGRIDALSLAELVRIPAYEPRRLGQTFKAQCITPLSELVGLLKKNPQVTAYIEVKKEAVAFAGTSATYACIKDCLAPVASQCIVMSFDHNFMLYVRSQGWPRCGVIIKRWKDIDSAKINAIRPDSVFMHYRKIPGKADLSCLDFELIVYEIKHSAQAIKWLERGANKLESFNVGGLLEQLDSAR